MASRLEPEAAKGADESSPDTQHLTVVDANTYPWSAVGALFNSDHTERTAVAVAADQVLTAARTLYGHRIGDLIAPGSLHVLMGFVTGDCALDATVRDYRVAAGYDRNRPIDTLNAD